MIFILFFSLFLKTTDNIYDLKRAVSCWKDTMELLLVCTLKIALNTVQKSIKSSSLLKLKEAQADKS